MVEEDRSRLSRLSHTQIEREEKSRISLITNESESKLFSFISTFVIVALYQSHRLFEYIAISKLSKRIILVYQDYLTLEQ